MLRTCLTCDSEELNFFRFGNHDLVTKNVLLLKSDLDLVSKSVHHYAFLGSLWGFSKVVRDGFKNNNKKIKENSQLLETTILNYNQCHCPGWGYLNI